MVGTRASAWGLQNSAQHDAAVFWQVLACARPTWLADWLLLRAEANAWGVVAYPLLRELGSELTPLVPPPTSVLAVIAERLRQDKAFLARDLPLLFDFATTCDAARAHVQKACPTAGPDAVANLSWPERNALLPQALAVTPETNDALRQTLDALLPEPPAAPLRKLQLWRAGRGGQKPQAGPRAPRAAPQNW